MKGGAREGAPSRRSLLWVCGGVESLIPQRRMIAQSAAVAALCFLLRPVFP